MIVIDGWLIVESIGSHVDGCPLLAILKARISSSMDSLLHMRIDHDHALIEIRMLPHKNLRIPGHGNENGIDTAR